MAADGDLLEQFDKQHGPASDPVDLLAQFDALPKAQPRPAPAPEKGIFARLGDAISGFVGGSHLVGDAPPPAPRQMPGTEVPFAAPAGGDARALTTPTDVDVRRLQKDVSMAGFAQPILRDGLVRKAVADFEAKHGVGAAQHYIDMDAGVAQDDNAPLQYGTKLGYVVNNPATRGIVQGVNALTAGGLETLSQGLGDTAASDFVGKAAQSAAAATQRVSAPEDAGAISRGVQGIAPVVAELGAAVALHKALPQGRALPINATARDIAANALRSPGMAVAGGLGTEQALRMAGESLSQGQPWSLGDVANAALLNTGGNIIPLNVEKNVGAQVLGALMQRPVQAAKAGAIERALQGAASMPAVGAGIAEAQHLSNPDQFQSPTLGDVASPGNVLTGAILGALGGREPTVAKAKNGAKPAPSAAPAGAMEAMVAALRAAGIPEDQIQAAMRDGTLADVAKAATPAPVETLPGPPPDAPLPTNATRALPAPESREPARPALPPPPRRLPPPTVEVDSAGNAATSADFTQQLRDAQAEAQRRAELGLTPDTQRAVAAHAERAADALDADRTSLPGIDRTLAELDGKTPAAPPEPVRGEPVPPQDNWTREWRPVRAQNGQVMTDAKGRPLLEPVLDLSRDTLLHWLGANGGINFKSLRTSANADPALLKDPAVMQPFGRIGWPAMRRNGGMTVDKAVERMQQDGWLPQDDPNGPPSIGHDEATSMILDALNGRQVTHPYEGADERLQRQFNDRAAQEEADRAVERHDLDSEALAQARQAWQDEGIHMRPEDAADALTLQQWIDAANDAGVPRDAAALAFGNALTVPEAVHNLSRLIEDRRRGTDQGSNAGDAARGLRPGGEGRAAADSQAGTGVAESTGPRGDLFPAANRAEQLRAAREAKDAERNGLNRPQQSFTSTDLGATPHGKAPEQASIPERAPEVSERDLSPEDQELLQRTRQRAELAHDNQTAADVLERESRERGEREAGELGLRGAVVEALGADRMGNVHFVHDQDGLPPDVRGRGKPIAQGNVRYGLHTPDGHTYIFTGAAKTPARAVWTAWHENGHEAVARIVAEHPDVKVGSMTAREAHQRAREMFMQNPTVARLAEVIAAQRKTRDLPRMAEEAMVELHAARETGDWSEIKRKYGVDVPPSMRDGVGRAIDNFVRRIKAILNAVYARISGDNSKPFTDADVHDFLRAMHETGKGERGGHMGGEQADQQVWHGTPHRGIEETGFKLNKIGTGEGAQAYGWGMYFAGRREIAEAYRENVTRRGHATTDAADAIARREFPNDRNNDIGGLIARAHILGLSARTLQNQTASIRHLDTAKLQRAIDDVEQAMTGQLYHAEIPEDHQLLDWDKPLAEQPEVVRKALQAYKDAGAPATVDGREIYRELQKPFVAERLGYELGDKPARAASEYLNSIGIPGLRYLDRSSRGKGDGSHNYVIWDEAHLNNDVTPYYSDEPARPRSFADQVRERLASGDRRGAMLRMGRAPAVLRMLGFDDLPLRMPPNVLFKLATGKGGERPPLTERQIAKLPEAIDDPVAVFDSESESGSLVAVTSMRDANSAPVLASIHPNGREGNADVHILTSAYGKDYAGWFQDQVDAGRLRYLDKTKGQTIPEVSSDALHRTTEPGRSGPSTSKILGPDDLRNYRTRQRDANLGEDLPSEEPADRAGEMGRGASGPATEQAPKAELPPRAPGETQAAFHARIMREERSPMMDGLRAVAGIGDKSDAVKMRDIGRGLMRQMWAKAQRAGDQASKAFDKAMAVFDKAGEKANREAINQWETGQEVTSAAHRLFFKAMQKEFDRRVEAIRAIAPGALENVIEHYFPHLWEDPTRAAKWYQSIMARQPLEGNKSFLKQRVHDTIEDGIAAGLKPVSTNPVDLVLAKMAAMDKFIAFHEMRKDLQDRGWLKEMDAGKRVPYGYAKVDDPAFMKAAGLQGYYAVPELIAKDINGYLAPSLYRFGAFKAFRNAENLVMQSRLGWSLFHVGFTTFENMTTHLNTGVQYALNGQLGKGLETILKTPWDSIVWAPVHGHKLNQQWLGLRQSDAHTAALLDALEAGGARWKMSRTDYNDDLPQFLRAIRQRDFGKMARKAFPAIGEASSWIIHHQIVPAQKMSARMLLAKFELDRVAHRLGKETGDYKGIIEAMHPDALRQMMGRVNNRIDDRLGQMTYDNQFWNKTAREAAQTLIGAVGWQVGTLRTVTGAAADIHHLWAPEKLLAPLDKAGTVTDAHLGRVSDRLTYLVMLATVMGGMAAATQYLLTGEGPSEVKDYFFPKTGRKNPDGSDERLQYPSYWMDHYKLATHPLQTAGHKIHPVFGMIMEAINNQDYYGVEVRDPHASWAKQAEQVGEYVAKGFLPYSWTNQQKAAKNEAGPARAAANLIGITTAPASVSRSKFQTFVAQNGNKGFGHERMTQADAEHSRNIRDITNQVRNGGKPDLSALDRRDLLRVRRESRVEVPELQFKKMSIEDKLDAWDMATPKERHDYHLRRDILTSQGTQTARFRRLPEDEQRAIMTRIREIRAAQSSARETARPPLIP